MIQNVQWASKYLFRTVYLHIVCENFEYKIFTLTQSSPFKDLARDIIFTRNSKTTLSFLSIKLTYQNDTEI